MRYLFFLLFSFYYLFANAHVFVYHRFDDPRHKSANTTSQQLIDQFEYLKQNGYKVVKLEQIIKKIQNNQKVPSNWVALTIDDAYKSFYKNGLPIFKKYEYPFSLFVYVKATNKHYGDFMSWDQIKDASKYGSIGLHSYSHPRLQNLSNQEIIKDTKKAYDIFEKKLMIKPKIYAYPYGEYNDNVKKILKDNFNFTAILNQNTGSVSSNTDIYDIPRIALVGDVNIKHKLRYTTFDVKWYEPKEFPKDGILRKVYASIDDKNIKKLNLYITAEGWKEVEVKDGIIDLDMNLYLKKARTRIMLGPNVFTISNNIINKIKNRKD